MALESTEPVTSGDTSFCLLFTNYMPIWPSETAELTWLEIESNARIFRRLMSHSSKWY